VELASTSYTAAPDETVALRGDVTGVPVATTLRVQYLVGDRWRFFPWPATTDADGRFTAYVELGATGTYELRVLDPQTGATSPVATLTIS
jgi:hypothetical protein